MTLEKRMEVFERSVQKLREMLLLKGADEGGRITWIDDEDALALDVVWGSRVDQARESIAKQLKAGNFYERAVGTNAEGEVITVLEKTQ